MDDRVMPYLTCVENNLGNALQTLKNVKFLLAFEEYDEAECLKRKLSYVEQFCERQNVRLWTEAARAALCSNGYSFTDKGERY